MKAESVYIFKNTEDRRNVENYQKLAEMLCRIDGIIKPTKLAETRKADRFYKDYDDAQERVPKVRPYFETRKHDLFLWVFGQLSLNEKEELYRIVRNEEEKRLVDQLMIGYACLYQSMGRFRDLDIKIKTRDFGKATELMRREKYKSMEAKAEKGQWYYVIQGEDGSLFSVKSDEIEPFTKLEFFFNRHIVPLEFEAGGKEEAEDMVQRMMRKPCITVEGLGEKISRAEYYDLLFSYFRALQMSAPDMPADFWDWLRPEKEQRYFENALFFYDTRVLTWDHNEEVAG